MAIMPTEERFPRIVDLTNTLESAMQSPALQEQSFFLCFQVHLRLNEGSCSLGK